MTSERATPGQLTFDLGGGHPAVGDAADLAIASAYSRAPPGVHGDHEEVSTFGMGAGTVPVYGRLNGRSLPEALREGWRKADELNAQQPADGESFPVAAIDVRLSLQPRERLEDDAVKQYAAAFDQLPLILVQRDIFVLVDGRHRLAAASEAISDHIRIRELDIADDHLADLAVRANVAHGVRLSQAERLKAAKHVFRRCHPITGGDQAWAVARIADRCGVSRTTVHGWLRLEGHRRTEVAAVAVAPSVPDQPASSPLIGAIPSLGPMPYGGRHRPNGPADQSTATSAMMIAAGAAGVPYAGRGRGMVGRSTTGSRPPHGGRGRQHMSADDVREFLENVAEIILYSAVAVALALVVFEIASRRFDLIREIREENNVAAGVLGGAFVLGIFYTVAQIVVS